MRWSVVVLTCAFAVSLSRGEAISVTGTVRDSSTKAALSDAIVRLRVNKAFDTTDASGAFTLTGTTATEGRRAAAGPASSVPVVVPGGGIRVGLVVPGRVVVTGHTLDGRQAVRVERSLPAGPHVIDCGAATPGVVLYRVLAGGRQCVLRQALAGGGRALRAVDEGSGGEQAGLARDAAFLDTVVVSKLGYASKRYVLSSTTTADLVFELSSAAAYAIVNLNTGAVSYVASVPDLETNEAYKCTLMVMRRIPAGTFKMGDEVGKHDEAELPVHTVNITKDTYVGVFEVTFWQWCIVTGCSRFEKKPLESKTWSEITRADGFPAKLTARSSLTFRLPTEAEWEYCCKAGTSTNYSYGNTPDGAWMWTAENSGQQTHEVGTTAKKPNPWGLYDMHGNVWELCSDYYDDWKNGYYYHSPLNDPQGPKASPYGTNRSLRSGSEWYELYYARSSRRGSVTEDHVSFCVGFRAVATAPVQ